MKNRIFPASFAATSAGVARKLLAILAMLTFGHAGASDAQTLVNPPNNPPLGVTAIGPIAYDRTLSVNPIRVAALTLKYPFVTTNLFFNTGNPPENNHAIGIAGNRMLWQAPQNWTVLWQLDDAGNYVSDVTLENPDPVNRSWRAISLSLAPTNNNAYVGGCFSRSDQQLYFVLWLSVNGDLRLDYVYGNGRKAIGAGIDIVQGTMRGAMPVGVAHVLGGTAILYTYPDWQTMSIHVLNSAVNQPNVLYVNSTALSSFNYPDGYYPVSLNGAPNSSGSWNINQVFFSTPNASWGRIYNFDASQGQMLSNSWVRLPQTNFDYVARAHTYLPCVTN